MIIIYSNSRTFVCVCPPLKLKVEPVAPDLESNVPTDIRPGVIHPDSSVGSALARNARGRRDTQFFFAFMVGYIYYLTCKHFLEVFVDNYGGFRRPLIRNKMLKITQLCTTFTILISCTLQRFT